MTFLSNLRWRYAVKKFDPSRQVADEDLQKILEAVRFAPSSYGLQPYHIFVIRDKALRARLKTRSFLQAQVTDSSVLLIFCARTDINDRIESYAELASGDDLLVKAKMLPLKLTMKVDVGRKTGETALGWASKQTGIALGFGLAAAAELGIDACPMEGFSARGVASVLSLPPHLTPVAYMAIGYRVEDPRRPKVRFPEEDLFTKI